MRVFFHGLSRFSLLAFALLFVTGPFTKANSETGSVLPYFFHTHTEERLDIIYRHDDTYDSSALSTLNHYLRDHRTNDIHAYDPRSRGHGVAQYSLHVQAIAIDIRIYGSQTLVRPSSAMSLCRCTAGAWDITPRPILCTQAWDGFGIGSATMSVTECGQLLFGNRVRDRLHPHHFHYKRAS